jgi:hypothetical protein
MKRFPFAILCVAISTVSLISFAQTSDQNNSQKPKTRSGAITGRVVDDSGTPIANARVFVSAQSVQGVRQTIFTDDSGKFVAQDLPRASYAVTVQVAGYTTVRQPGDTVHHTPGDSVTLVVRKGGAITGRVTSADGDPIVGVQITATLVRDERGRRNESTFGNTRYTDDRGIYRIFGLPPGTYIVAAGSKLVGGGPPNAYVDDVPTYHPSSNRDTAAEISLPAGGEAAGIDIRYRSEKGAAVSGSIVDPNLPEMANVGVNVTLMRATTDTMESQAYIQPRGSDRGFSLYGIPDGDYYLSARRSSYQGNDGAASKRVPVKVRGHDISGIEISMVPLGSIAGRLILNPATREIKCESTKAPAAEETLLSLSSDDNQNPDPSSRFSSPLLQPDDKGDFVFSGLPAGPYRIDSRSLLDETWYVSDVTVPAPTNTPVSASIAGLAVKSGQRLSGVRVVLGQGAALVKGQIEKGDAPLPDRLLVHLIPSEAEQASNTLRYLETEVQSDGSFKIANIPPGRYLMLARQPADEAPALRLSRPQAWNTKTRALLRREATEANAEIELKACQKVVDYKLRWKKK